MHMLVSRRSVIILQIFLSDVDLRNIDITYNKKNLSELSNLFPEVSSLYIHVHVGVSLSPLSVYVYTYTFV